MAWEQFGPSLLHADLVQLILQGTAIPERLLVGPASIEPGSQAPGQSNKAIPLSKPSEDPHAGFRIAAADLPRSFRLRREKSHVGSPMLVWHDTQGQFLPFDEHLQIGPQAPNPPVGQPPCQQGRQLGMKQQDPLHRVAREDRLQDEQAPTFDRRKYHRAY